MGLLDALLGGMLGGQQGAGQASQQQALIQMVLQLLQQSGGLSGLSRQMQQQGYGDQAQSWIGTGQNMPISADALSQIFGQERMGQLGQQFGQQFGMSNQDVAGRMAQALPDVVDRMTPQGRIPDNQDDLVARTLEELMRGNR